MIAVFGYGSLMTYERIRNMFSDENTSKKVLLLPVRIKPIIYLRRDERFIEKYYVRRKFSNPIVGRILPDDYIDNNWRSALIFAPISENERAGCEFINGVILLGLNSKHLDYLRRREMGYDECFIRKDSIVYVYPKFAKDFLARYLVLYPDKAEEILDKLGISIAYLDYTTLRDELEKIDFEIILNAIFDLLPEEIIVFAEVPRKQYSTDLVRRIIQIYCDLFGIRDDPQRILQTINVKRKTLVEDTIGSFIEEELKKYDTRSLVDRLEEAVGTYLQTNNTKTLLSVLEEYNMADILGGLNEVDAFIVILGHVLKKIIVEESKEVLRKLLVEELKLELLPLRDYLEMILKDTCREWGPEFVRDFLDTSYLDNGKKLSEFDGIDLVKELKNILSRETLDISWLSNPYLNWIFIRNLRQSVDPISIIRTLVAQDKIRGAGYLIYEKTEMGYKVLKKILLNSQLDNISKSNIYTLLERKLDMLLSLVNISAIENKSFALAYIGDIKFIVVGDEDVWEEVVIDAEVYAIIFSIGLISIIYRVKNLDSVLRKVPVDYIMDLWSSIPEHFNNIRIIDASPETDIFPNEVGNLSRLAEHIAKTIRMSCNLRKREISYKIGINHPIFFFSLNKNLPPDEFSEVLEIRMENIRKFVSKGLRKAISSRRDIENLSTNPEFALFTDFNSMVIYNNTDYLTFREEIIDYLTLIYTFILIMRQTVVIVQYELEELVRKGFLTYKRIVRFQKLQRKWMNYLRFIMPNRIFRQQGDRELAEKLMKIFRVNQYMRTIEILKSDVDYYLSKIRSDAETLSFILINILLSGSLAVDLSNNIISKYLAPTPWTYLIVWFFISLITILIIQVVPKMYFRYKHKTLFRT